MIERASASPTRLSRSSPGAPPRRRGGGGDGRRGVARAAMRGPEGRPAPPWRAPRGEVSMAAGAVERRCEWTVTGDLEVSRAERPRPAFADAEVLCDLLVVAQCASSGIIDFDPVPHAAGNDVVCARNLSAGNLDRIVRAPGDVLGKASAAARSDVFRRGGQFFRRLRLVVVASSEPRRTCQRGSVAGDGVAPGPCVLMPQGTRENFGDASAKQRTAREKRLEARRRRSAPRTESGPADKEDKEEDAAARRAAEAEAAKLGACPTARWRLCLWLRRLRRRPKRSAAVGSGEAPRAPPSWRTGRRSVGRRSGIIAEAQEAMAPSASFPLGACARGKTRAPRRPCSIYQKRGACGSCARAARTPWTRLCARTRAGGGSSIMSGGSFALASFQRLFHQLLGFSAGGHLEGAQSRGRGAAGGVRRGARAARALRQAHPRDSGYRKSGRGRGGRRGGRARLGPVVRWSGGTLRSGDRAARAAPELGPLRKRQRAKTLEPIRTTRSPRRGRRRRELRGERSTRGGGGRRRRLVARLGELSGR